MDKQQTFPWEDLERRSVPELWTVQEIYDELTDQNILKFAEDHRVEWKSAGIHADSLATYFCMHANTPPDGGVLILGIEDDGEVTGCSAKSAHVTEVERRIKCDLVPDAAFDTKRVYATNSSGSSDYLTLFRVYYREDKVVETNKEESYIRRVDTRHLLTEGEKRELQLERGQVSFELEACGLKWPDEFDLIAIRDWVAGVVKRKALREYPTVPQVLVAHKLGKMTRGDFVPNNACALLFAKDPQNVVPGCMIRFQRIEGLEAATGAARNVVKDVQITGTIPQLIERSGAVLETHLRMYSRLGKDGKFYTAPEYPPEAWQEAIVNACAHRSYSLKGMNIFIKMFDDRLVVESPGGFPPTVTPENIYEVHHRRNWWLMDAMFYLDYVQCENEGVKRILRAMTEMELPQPEFEQKQIVGALVRVTLRNNQVARRAWVDADVSTIIGAERARGLTDLELRVINFAAEHDGKIKTTEAMNLMPKPRWGSANAILVGLEKKGILREVKRYPRDPRAYFAIDVQSPVETDDPPKQS